VAKAKTEQQMNRSPHEAVLPENANLPLLHCWEGLASRGIPILILNKPDRKSADMKARAKAFDYLEYVLGLADGKSKVAIRLAEGSDHSFSNCLGRVAVRQHVEEWLDDNFSSNAQTDSDEGVLLRESDTTEMTVGMVSSV
jgi:hypothetical protein